MTNELIAPPTIVPLARILPEEPLLMMGAGPVPIPQSVASANSIVINHLGESMNRVIEQVKAMGRYVFQTDSSHVIGVAGPGSAAMEMAIVNLVHPDARVLCICNGYFSRRMADMVARVNATPVCMDIDGNVGADVNAVESGCDASASMPFALCRVKPRTPYTTGSWSRLLAWPKDSDAR